MNRNTIDLDAMADLATPVVGWVLIDAVSARLDERRAPRRHDRDPHSLISRARALPLDTAVVYNDTGVAVRVTDLGRLLSREELRAIEGDMADLESEEINLTTARPLLGLTHARDRTLLSLLARRGIGASWASGRAEVPMSGCLWLGRLLAAERCYRGGPEDLVPLDVALPLLRQATDGYRAGPDSGPADELDARADELDVRGNWAEADEGWRTWRTLAVNGWDLYRLCGLAAPGLDVAKYRAWLDAVYRDVGPTGGRPGIGDDDPESESEPEDTPTVGRRAAAPVA